MEWVRISSASTLVKTVAQKLKGEEMRGLGLAWVSARGCYPRGPNPEPLWFSVILAQYFGAFNKQCWH